jgi:hypothetical protein
LFTVAENCCCVADGGHEFPGSSANRFTVGGATVTVTCGPVSVTVAVPGAVASGEVAVTVTVAGLGIVSGAVYSPFESMVPFVLPPVTAHVTD